MPMVKYFGFMHKIMNFGDKAISPGGLAFNASLKPMLKRTRAGWMTQSDVSLSGDRCLSGLTVSGQQADLDCQ